MNTENKNIVSINIGSTSKKYASFSNGVEIKKEEFEINDEGSFKKYVGENTNNIDAILIRIVAPGKLFRQHREIDNDYIKALEDVEHISPFHIKNTIKELIDIKSVLPNIKIIGISDSEFFKTLKEEAKIYPLPKEIRDMGIERQGYHGLSITSVLESLKNNFGKIPSKIIVCHLGGGSSVTAISNGGAIDTSMGFTPLGGLIMEERMGDIDPGVITTLINKYGLDETLNIIYEKSGLEAISNIQRGDIKKIIESRESADDSKIAISAYTYSIKKTIGSMFFALGGCDLLVFTGSVAIKSSFIREEIMKDIENCLNIKLDKVKNESIEESNPTNISTENNIFVVPIDEMRVMYSEYQKLLI
jgi:acetate kinase